MYFIRLLEVVYFQIKAPTFIIGTYAGNISNKILTRHLLFVTMNGNKEPRWLLPFLFIDFNALFQLPVTFKLLFLPLCTSISCYSLRSCIFLSLLTCCSISVIVILFRRPHLWWISVSSLVSSSIFLFFHKNQYFVIWSPKILFTVIHLINLLVLLQFGRISRNFQEQTWEMSKDNCQLQALVIGRLLRSSSWNQQTRVILKIVKHPQVYP